MAWLPRACAVLRGGASWLADSRGRHILGGREDLAARTITRRACLSRLARLLRSAGVRDGSASRRKSSEDDGDRRFGGRGEGAVGTCRWDDAAILAVLDARGAELNDIDNCRSMCAAATAACCRQTLAERVRSSFGRVAACSKGDPPLRKNRSNLPPSPPPPPPPPPARPHARGLACGCRAAVSCSCCKRCPRVQISKFGERRVRLRRAARASVEGSAPCSAPHSREDAK